MIPDAFDDLNMDDNDYIRGLRELQPTWNQAIGIYGHEYVVPYLADFTGTRENGRSQRPVPRPYYCTRYLEEASFPNLPGVTPPGVLTAFDKDIHHWYFFSMPSSIALPSTQIYIDPMWIWTSNSGNPVITP